MDCQTNVVEVFSEMENKSIINLAIVAFSAAFGACMFYGSIGIAGSLLFGDNMPNEDIITILANSESSLVKYLSSRNSKFYCVHYLVPCLAILGLWISSVYQLSAVTRSLNEKKIFKKILTLNIRQVVTTGTVIIGVSIFNMFPQISLELVFAFIGQFMEQLFGLFFSFYFYSLFILEKEKNLLLSKHDNSDLQYCLWIIWFY
ncbi:putative aminoacid transporter [Nosema bombycis CQ1]|uniref:Putative aminoacid transporter n=1 Tax=Nosema bombycis (strain CQ1 / CVCC 102059) TaxID=578461 RepID=R0KMF2_NOSB1|nr:putative aminoacid transporter [Nosema bombycis CQ1]|eukprot:EOB11831.1 putative aminoacid transporter [Nosema bombycis CQ1]